MTSLALASACLLAVTFGYIVRCWLSPFGDCRKCRGLGHHIKFNRRGKPKRTKDCRRCDGTGKRIRVGRWIYNRGARTYRAGTR